MKTVPSSKSTIIFFYSNLLLHLQNFVYGKCYPLPSQIVKSTINTTVVVFRLCQPQCGWIFSHVLVCIWIFGKAPVVLVSKSVIDMTQLYHETFQPWCKFSNLIWLPATVNKFFRQLTQFRSLINVFIIKWRVYLNFILLKFILLKGFINRN